MTLGNNVSGVDGMNSLLATVVSVDPVHAYADLDEAVLLRLNRFRTEKQLPVDEQGRIRVGLGLADEEGFPSPGPSLVSVLSARRRGDGIAYFRPRCSRSAAHHLHGG
jgi:hypothetical protein